MRVLLTPKIANLVLQGTTERIFAPKDGPSSTSFPQSGLYADVSHGLYIVRGENVLLLGEIDLDKDDDPPPGYEIAELAVVKKLAEQRKILDKAKEKARSKKLSKMGFEGENMVEIIF